MTTNSKSKSAIVELNALLEDDEDRLRPANAPLIGPATAPATTHATRRSGKGRDPLPGGADRHRHQLRRTAPDPGGGDSQPGVPQHLEGLSRRVAGPGPAWGGVRGQRRSRRSEEGHPGSPQGGRVAALLRAFPAQRTRPYPVWRADDDFRQHGGDITGLGGFFAEVAFHGAESR